MSMSSSSDRGVFRKHIYLKKLEVDPTDQHAIDMLDYLTNSRQQTLDIEQDTEWQKNNLEYDLRSTDWILEKVRVSESYAQNLYAALCNNDFQKRDVMPILKDEIWTCTWRQAGGIIADMRQTGDYIDWYCSGSRGNVTESEFQSMTDQEKQLYQHLAAYVSEGVVTEEIEQDLLKLGWNVIENGETAI